MVAVIVWDKCRVFNALKTKELRVERAKYCMENSIFQDIFWANIKSLSHTPNIL